MIVNLAMQTRTLIANAGLNIADINYVIFFNPNTMEKQYCSFSEFMDIADEINYEELDPTMVYRRVIHSDLAIVADRWWLQRTTNPEDVESWVYQEIPTPMDNMEQGTGELEAEYIVAEIDLIEEDYLDLIEPRSAFGLYLKPQHITIEGKQYLISDEDGIDKVIDNDKVAVIVAGDGGHWWTNNVQDDKDPRMIFHPELIKLVMEDRYEQDGVITILQSARGLDLNIRGFETEWTSRLTVQWVPRGTEFLIVYDQVNDDEPMCEQIMINPKNWLIS